MSFFKKLTGQISRGQEENKNMPESKETLKNNLGSETEGQLSIDVFQTPSDIVIKSTIAGVKPENLDIAITNDMVTIRGRRERDESLENDDYFYQECYWGPFSRSIILPTEVQTEKSLATLKNGVLTIKLPKTEKIKTKKIEIKHREE
jgi:HSP20 family protein